MKTVSVQAIASEIQRRFHIEMDIYDVISNTAEVLKKMGMIALSKETSVHLVQNFSVKLPSTVHKIESVVQMQAYKFPTEVIIQNIVHPPSYTIEREYGVPTADLVDNNGESAKYVDSARPNYLGQVKGVYTDFVWECPYVKFNFNDYYVSIEMVKLSEDANGLPLIPEECFSAAVYYNVYTYMEPVYLTGKIPDITFQRVEQWKNKHINQAKNSYMFSRLNKNERDKIFDIFTSFDRKRVNIDN